MSETKTVEDWLNSVDYGEDVNYVPSAFALEFVNFIKLVNGDEGEENKTPVLHYKMLDNIQGKTQNNLNMVFRGAAKALTLDTQLIGVNGNVSVKDVQVGDFLFDRNGIPTKILAKSEVFNKPVYEISLTDGRRLNVSEDHINIVLYRTVVNGKWVFKEYELTTKELLDKGVVYNRKVSDRNPTGRESKWYIPTAKAVQFSKQDFPLDPYTVGVILGDGSVDKTTGFTRIHSHINDVPHYINNIPYTISCIKPDLRNENTYRFSIKGIGKLVKEHVGVDNVYSKRVPPTILRSSFEDRLAVLQGLMDTDGTISKNKSSSTSFTTVSELLANDVLWLVRSLGGEATLKENHWNGRKSYRISIRLDVCPFRLERKANLWEANVTGKTAIADIKVIAQQPSQCLMVESPTKSFLAESFVVTHNTTLMGEYFFLYLATYGDLPGFGTVDLALYVSDSVENGVKNMRKNLEFRWENSAFLQEYVPEARFTDIRWEFTNKDGKVFIVKGYGAKTGVRGSKELGKRPQLALLDDLVSDEDARSPTVIASIEDTVYKAIDYALHPTKRKVIWNGTPFNSNDPLYKAVESGAWSVSVYPVCNEFPCSREDFKGAWEDRFTYDYVKAMYDKALKTGKVAGFNQELMLRIISDEDRLVLDSDLVWYKSSTVMSNKSSYNFYITTDFATSEKTSADFSVISVWAYSSNGDWLLVDGICKRQTMDKNVNDLFKFVSIYRPQSVGVEVTGQQGGFIPWLYDQMIVRNIFFNLASENNSGKAGIRPSTNKMQRFNVVLPWFKTKKIWLPEDKKNEFFVVEMLEELRYASANGFKSKHDDSIDTISQLAVIGAWKPSQDVQVIQDESGIWKEDPSLNRHENSMSSYIV